MSEKAIDPVCGMEIITDEAAAQTTYEGQTYYFCAPGCKVQFDQNPEKYIKDKTTSLFEVW